MEVDVVVIGGGPGGCSAATLIAQHGHRVMLLERDKFPRHHIGESLLPSSLHGVFAVTGVKEKLDRAGFVRKNGGVFRWGKNPDLWHIRFAESVVFGQDFGYSYQVERARLDQILLEHARENGVDAREGHRALEVLFEGERAVGVRFADQERSQHQVRCRWIVDAAGINSLLANTIGERVYDPFFKNVAIYRYYSGASRLPGENAGNILVAAFPGGWFWFVPLSHDLTSLGAVLDSEHASTLLKHKTPEEVVDVCVSDCPTIASLLQGASPATDPMYDRARVARDYSYLNSRFWCPGAVIIGDAACFIDPLFSTGVHLATYSALLAACSINTVLDGDLDEKRCFTEFEMRFRREYAAWHMMAVGFYDTNHDQESYFWNARSILGAEKMLSSDESAREAFITMIGGGLAVSNDPHFAGTQAYIERMRKTSSTYREVIAPDPSSGAPQLDSAARAAAKGELWKDAMRLIDADLDRAVGADARVPHAPDPLTGEQPLYAGGLITSPRGLKWREPTTAD